MYSLNVPVPARISRLASGLAAGCHTAAVRSRHTLVAKRLGEGDPRQLSARAREAVAGTDPFPVRVSSLASFDRPPSGTAPVVYLAIESPELGALHRRLCDAFDPVPSLEGERYVPHVTIARGGDAAVVLEESVEPDGWTAEGLVVWDGTYDEPIERLALPA